MKLELAELAECLKLPVYTVDRWIRQGRIPARKTGNLCVFKWAVLEKWAEKHEIRFSRPDEPPLESETVDRDGLLAALTRGGVHYGVAGDTVPSVLESAVSLIPDVSDDDRDLLLSKLLEREKLVSTGLGKGVAIPHPRSPLLGSHRQSLIAACFLKNTIDFAAIDKQGVAVMFVLVCPTVKAHLHLLSRISFCLRDAAFVELLHQPPPADVFFDRIREFENELDRAQR